MLDRRKLLTILAGTGAGTAVFHRALATLIQQEEETRSVTVELVRDAEWISDVEFTDEERESIAKGINRSLEQYQKLREQKLGFEDLPAVHFQPLCRPPSGPVSINRSVSPTESATVELPSSEADIAFLPVKDLASLIRRRQISSLELTRIYLARLEKYNPLLNCVVNLTEDLAVKQAKQADREIAAGQYRGSLHGIPWGAKDLIAVPGYPTTWGIPQFRERELPYTATVARRLEQAGAVLVAKLSLGAIAMGDKWFNGMTRSPWNYKIGSSGSSAGSASATVAGLVGFALGSETLGSIISPSRRCGATGLRPTFGRVSRAGCMPLSWTMDKIGPITRHVEDCALVFAAIHGDDGQDPTVFDRAFEWPAIRDFQGAKVGYTRLRRRRRNDDQEETEPAPRPDLEILESMGCELVEIELPEEASQWVLADTIDVEAASVFDEMLRARTTEGWNTWTATFRQAQFISALDYFRIQRRRRQLQHKFEELMSGLDFLVNCSDLLITNLTGHPSVVMPTGYRDVSGKKVPQSALLTGHLNDESRLLALSLAFQQHVTAHLQRPPLDEQLAEMESESDESSGEESPDGSSDG